MSPNYTRGAERWQWKGGRTSVHGYIAVFTPDHPRAWGIGYVFEHIIVAEKALGRPLLYKAEVHHVNEQKWDNRNANLVICEDRAYHQLLHKRMRAYRATG